MVEKKFYTRKGYLHIPVHSGEADSFQYIEVLTGNVMQGEFLIGICAPGEAIDYYIAMDVKRYGYDTVTLICRDEQVKETLFDGVLEGGPIEEEPNLYPNLYKEQARQQIHFSPKCGWLNDPNGLFYKDGVYHMYFQHNPFANHHYDVNICWGHATSTDRVHFIEHEDVIMPTDSRITIASGSAIVDKYNISGLGENTVLAAYTHLIAGQWKNRPTWNEGGAQNLAYSLDEGMSFCLFDFNPIIEVPAGESYRDPKILQIDEKTFCIVVFELFEGKGCFSIYKSTNLQDWEFCSRIMDLYECPDLFPMRVNETDEELWVLFDGAGNYYVGSFHDFCFEKSGDSGQLDYGNCVYAYQTFNCYDDPYVRLHMGWMQDGERKWFYDKEEPFQQYGFSQCMTFMCELTLHKVENTYRLFRTPVKEMKSLRRNGKRVRIEREYLLPVPGEAIFRFDSTKDFGMSVGEAGFIYNADERKIVATSKKEYILQETAFYEVRIFADTRSVEIFIENQFSMSYFAQPKQQKLILKCEDAVWADVYELNSIYAKSENNP